MCACFCEIIGFIIRRMQMKIISHSYNVNKPRSTHVYKFSKYKTCLSMKMRICIKQHQSNIWKLISWKSNTEAVLKK